MIDQLTVQDDAGIRVVRWNRPEALNAMSMAMWNATREALETAASDGNRVVVLTGVGRAFTVGQDLGEFADPGHGEEGAGFRGLMKALSQLPVPLVAAVNGMAVGFGLTVLPWCDLVIAAESARFKAPFVDLGVVTEAAASVALSTVIGPQAAVEMLLTGDWFSADWAVASGLVVEAVPDGELLSRAMSIAETIAAKPPDATRTTIRLVREGHRVGWDKAIDKEYEEMARLAGGAENLEAITRFFERK